SARSVGIWTLSDGDGVPLFTRGTPKFLLFDALSTVLLSDPDSLFQSCGIILAEKVPGGRSMIATSVRENVAYNLTHQCRVSEGSSILVGLSGGSDSVALLRVLVELASELNLDVGAAHLNHRLRGEESDRDETFVVELCRGLDVPLIVSRLPAGLLDPKGPDLEARAREARFDFLEKSRIEGGHDFIALGHHRDDQAETLLLALIRGSGAGGLGAMSPRRGRIIRPLLDLSREDLKDYLGEVEVDYVTDSTNLIPGQARNRIRLDLLPKIARDYNPGIAEVLARTARLLGDEDRYLQGLAGRKLRECARYEGFGGRGSGRKVVLDGDVFDQPKALLRRILRLAYMLVRGTMRDLTFHHVESLTDLEMIPGGWGVELPAGVRAFRRGREVVFAASATATACCDGHGILPVPGKLVLERSGTVLYGRIIHPPRSARVVRSLLEDTPPLLVSHAFIDYNKVELPLHIRFWKPGDRMRPLGMSGHRKIQDIFVDDKVPRTERSRVPLVLDDDHRVLWLAGVRVAEFAKLDGDTDRVLHLRIARTRS
ncbi:MAG: tRNA lysidine(34) synthetase TilS, partial [Bacillota bacterium]